MAMSKKDCVAALRRHGATESEALDIVDMMLEEKERLKAAGITTPQGLSQRWSSVAEAMKHNAKMRARRHAISVMRFNEASAFIDSVKAQGFSGMDGIQALMVGSSKRFDGARRSVSALREGIYKSWMSPLLTELEAVDNGLHLMREDKAFHDDIFREMREPGSTGNAQAQQIGEIFSRYTEQARQQLNAAGADIGKLDGWTPQTHDQYKLLQGGERGRQEWIDFVFDRLDVDRSFPGATPQDLDAILDHVRQDILTGKPLFLPQSDSMPHARASSKFEHHPLIFML